jgi:hypothetical protein
MVDRKAAFDEKASHEYGAVTFERVLLGTHQRQSKLSRPLCDTIHPPLKQRSSGQQIVSNLAIAVAATIG